MQERVGTLAVALLCSLLGHGVLLFAMPLPPPVHIPRLAGAIEVSLRVGEVPVPASAPPSLPAEILDAPTKPLNVPKPTRTPVAPIPTPVQPVPTVAAVLNTEPVRTEGGHDEDSAAPMVAAQPVGESGAGGASRQGVATPASMDDALQDYRFAISSVAAKFKRYPALSRERGREGRVEVSLIWRPGMHTPQVELHASAGDALLNEQGLAMLRQAAMQTPLPEALRERAFSLILPVEFSLGDATR
jgi:protein TonB